MIVTIDTVPNSRWVILWPAVLWAVVAALLVAVTVVYAYSRAFSIFMVYDDEGFMAETFELFADGNPLYDAIPTLYGPYYYSAKFFIHRVLGVPLTSENIRWITILVWSTTAVVTALAAWRVTRRASAAVLAYVLTVIHLSTAICEPGHPQDHCGLLLALAAVLATWAPERPLRVVAALGAVAACLILTKVNIGVFAALAMLLALATTTEGRLTRRVAAALGLAAVALPFVLLRQHLGTSWGRSYALVVVSGLVALILQAGAVPKAIATSLLRVVGLFLGGFAAAAAIPIALVLLRGSTPRGLLDGLLLMPLRLKSAFVNPALFTNKGAAWGLLSVAMSAAFLKCAPRAPARGAFEGVAAVLKAAFGAFVVACVLGEWRRLLIDYATPLLWLILVPSSYEGPHRDSAMPRAIIAFLATLQVLQAYPVAGSQIYFGTFLYGLVAAISLGDALGWAEGRLGAVSAAGRRARLVLPIVASLLVTVLGERGYRAYREYLRLTPLTPTGGRGPGCIRLQEGRSATFRWLVSNLSRHATTFECNTGFNSLYLWTGLKPPTCIVIGNAIDIFTEEQQRAVVGALRESPNPCVIYQPDFFDGLGARRPSPLLDEFREAYVTCGKVDGIEFRVPVGRALPTLVDCVRPGPPAKDRTAEGARLTAALTLLPVRGSTAYRFCIVDTSDGSVLADTRPNGTAPLRVVEVTSRRVLMPTTHGGEGLDLTSPRDLTLEFPSLKPAAEAHLLVVRLLGEGDEPIISLPFLATLSQGRGVPPRP